MMAKHRLVFVRDLALLPADEAEVVLAYVARSKASEGTFYVHPELPVVVKRADVSTSESDHFNTIFEVGDIATLRVGRNAKGGLRLTGLDIDDDEPVARDRDRDVLQVVLAGAANDELVLGHGALS